MKNIFSILFALVLVVSVTLVGACGEGPRPEPYVQWDPDVHGEVTFYQLSIMASPEEALYPYSNVGEVEFTFLEGAGDWLLDEVGGGWLNVVIDTTAAGGNVQWAVQNLYLVYPDLDYLYGSTPSVQFSLGLDNETPIGILTAAVFLGSQPLEEQPEAEELVPYTVSLVPYLIGSFDGQASADSTIPLTNGPSIGGPFIGPHTTPWRTSSICIPVDQVENINEDFAMCACGAFARSIRYLGRMWNFATDNPQEIYDDLVTARETIFATNLTWPQKVLALKQSYCGQKCPNTTSELVFQTGVVGGTTSWNDLTEKVKDALDACCDVEIWYKWRLTVGGNWTDHMAMVTSITDYYEGNVTTTIRVVDDPVQGNNAAQNNEHVISTNSTGWDPNRLRFVYGFMIQCPRRYDHFKCYEVERQTASDVQKDVYLEDQFGSVNATVWSAKLFCNPVMKWHDEVLTPIFYEDHHLTVYSILCQEEPQTWRVEVKNQFGTQNLTVLGPVALAVPTQKVEPEYHQPPVDLDHFLLYNVIEGPSISVGINLTDQFHEEPKVLVEGPPIYFANPVLKRHGYTVTEIENPQEHLVFYEIQGGTFGGSVVAANQFGEQTLNLTRPAMLAVPSEKSYFAPAPEDRSSVAAGGGHTVGLKSNGTLVAVGRNDKGQCNVGNWTDIIQVGAGYLHTVGLKSDGTVVAVGSNEYGQCNVGGWTDTIQIGANGYHTVGLKSDGTVVAVGSNTAGQCNVGGWTDIIQVAPGYLHTAGLRGDGTVVAVGHNGDGECDVGGWTDIVQVSADTHTVGLKGDGTVVAVGWNEWGQCDVGGWTNITQVDAGQAYTVGLKADGTVVAVGVNTYGQCNVGGWVLRPGGELG